MQRRKENKMVEEKTEKKTVKKAVTPKVEKKIVEKVESKKEDKTEIKETKIEAEKTDKLITRAGVHQRGASSSSSPPTDVGGKKIRKEIEAVLNIYTSFNNTLVHATDMSGVTIAKITGGMVTKHSRLKANPTVGMFIAKRIAESVKDLGVTSFYVRIRAKTGNPAPGPGANAIIKSLTREGFRILNILDTTRSPRGGPKKKGGRRGRRP